MTQQENNVDRFRKQNGPLVVFAVENADQIRFVLESCEYAVAGLGYYNGVHEICVIVPEIYYKRNAGTKWRHILSAQDEILRLGFNEPQNKRCARIMDLDTGKHTELGTWHEVPRDRAIGRNHTKIGEHYFVCDQTPILSPAEDAEQRTAQLVHDLIRLIPVGYGSEELHERARKYFQEQPRRGTRGQPLTY